MRLMNGIRIFVAKLLDDLLDLIKFLRCREFSNHTLKTAMLISSCQLFRGQRCLLESANLAFIVKFVIQGALYTRLHVGK